LKFKDKVALVTGGADGIGKSCCLLLAEKGAKVIVADISMEKAEKTCNEISEKGGEATPIKVDVSNVEEIRAFVNISLAKYENIDILINSAGICESRNIEEITVFEWNKMMDVNLKGTFFMIQAVLPTMKKNQYGKIVNFSSVAGDTGGGAVGAHYAISKAGVRCLSKAIAKRVATYNININTVSPGYIATEMTKNSNQDVNNVPFGRSGKPKEVADVVLFLCSEEANYLTGTNININGGLYMD